MRRLIRAIINGIGWSAGEDIYREAKKQVREGLARLPQEKTERQLAREARAAAKALRAADKRRAAAAKAREKSVETELAALKRKVGR